MKTIRFTDRGQFYGCSEPGEQSGEYVRADVAGDLLDAAEAALERIDFWGGAAGTLRAAVARAKGEDDTTTEDAR